MSSPSPVSLAVFELSSVSVGPAVPLVKPLVFECRGPTCRDTTSRPAVVLQPCFDAVVLHLSSLRSRTLDSFKPSLPSWPNCGPSVMRPSARHACERVYHGPSCERVYHGPTPCAVCARESIMDSLQHKTLPFSPSQPSQTIETSCNNPQRFINFA